MTVEDERGAGAMRALMAEVDLPPSSVDVDLAVRTARRLDRRLRVTTAAAVVLAVGTASGAVAVGIGGGQTPDDKSATRECTGPPTVTALAAPDIDHAGLTFTGADPSGRYLVGIAHVQSQDRYIIRGVLWVDGSPRVFNLPPQDKNELTYATDVNGAGLVVGGDVGDIGGSGPWTYRDGEFRRLPAAPGYDLYNGMFVNERGDVVATAGARDGESRSSTTPSVGVVWPADAPDQPRILRAPGWVTVTGIGDDGTVLGYVGDDFGSFLYDPYAWSPGARRGRSRCRKAGSAALPPPSGTVASSATSSGRPTKTCRGRRWSRRRRWSGPSTATAPRWVRPSPAGS
ncbi:hypothetical protein ACFQ1L_30200 [Phytohabitans flavus]|uniref:Uncharacterized protein n=1 Tax=Phytohabitans flavus TaxID=1076124 RepID=A0A6F8XPG7_9ACTN|nr:hypothetical protein [Phytohabitans flavus]BCB75658.1 hypothetical protein Pflav_020680 [Phytohabitans flavus]